MDVSKIALIQASLGKIDKPREHTPQSIPYKHFLYTDENFPPRVSLTPRMQAKIPKFFGWQLVPDFEAYMWLDGNFTLNDGDTLQYFAEQLVGHDIVVLRHPSRPDIRQEVRYTRKGINQQSRYMVSRYAGDWHEEAYKVITDDTTYKDDLLVNGGVFMYRNTPEVQQAMKDWWYYTTRYIVNDQIFFPYVLRNLRVNILNHVYDKWNYLKYERHATNVR